MTRQPEELFENIYNLIQNIAEYLDGWEAGEVSSHQSRLHGPDGAVIFLRPDRYEFTPDCRLEVTGLYPIHPQHGSFVSGNKVPGITIAASRGGQTIARDIQNRFLPQYLPLYRQALERKAKYEARESRRQQQLSILADLLGTTPGAARVYVNSQDSHGYFEMLLSDQIDVKLSLPWTLALKVAVMLTEKEGIQKEGEDHVKL